MAASFSAEERRALKAHIKTLEEQLAWTRSLISGQVNTPMQGLGPPMESGALWTSEDEEDARELHDAGLIDQDELNAMLDAAGALNTDIEFHTP